MPYHKNLNDTENFKDCDDKLKVKVRQSEDGRKKNRK